MKLKLITIAIIISNILLLSQDIPTNIIILAITSLIGSLFIHQKTVRTVIKLAILISSMALLRYHFKVLLVTECAVSFVLVLSAIKFWELDEERDHFNMFLILALSECSIFLLNPTFLVFAFGMAKMFFYFYYILKIRNYDIGLLNTKRLLLLVTPSIILSLILFYTFPRFTQGFLNTNDMQYLISGGSSRMDFKELGPLSTSTEQAFKVYGLENSKMPFKLLYWKSTVLWHLANNEWTSSNEGLKRTVVPTGALPRLKYDVEVFQSFKEHLPTLDGYAAVTTANLPFNSYADGSFRLKTISRGVLNYSVIGTYGERSSIINPTLERKGLRIRSDTALEVKKAYLSNADFSLNDEARLKALIQIFKGRIFEYSITPPMYNSIEDFLLNGKQGYCSHFASAFTYLARLYNLPARIVTGYLGGEFNPYDNSVIVRELDAHAWVEIFISSRGWVKIDPTSLVAPARMNMSAQEFNSKQNPYITIFNMKIDRDLFNSQSINNLSLWLDSLNSKFNTNIFNFDRDRQLVVLRALTPGKLSIGWIFSLSLALFLVIFWFIFYLYGKKQINPAEKRYYRFLKKMESLGVPKDAFETISSFEKRCLSEMPQETSYIRREVCNYINSFYK